MLLRETVLIAEPSRAMSRILKERIQDELHLRVIEVDSVAAITSILEERGDELLAAVVSMNVKGNDGALVVHHIIDHRIPCIVATATFSEPLRDHLIELGVADYILKDSQGTQQLIGLLRRLRNNMNVRVLVVDDSPLSRELVCHHLHRYRIQTLIAANGNEALDILDADGGIQMVITDYDMPELDGFDLVRKLREKHSRNSLAVIGISGSANKAVSAKFLKLGANDYLGKPFGSEELYCRVAQNLDMLEYIAALKETNLQIQKQARTDHLTGLNNRRYFWELSANELERSRRTGRPLSSLMLDIDHFKSINDRYGHDVGDMAIRAIAHVCRDNVRPYDILGRFGGEEFVLVLPDDTGNEAIAIAERLRSEVENLKLQVPGGTLSVTISVGVSTLRDSDMLLENMLKRADDALYTAKRNGRNRVETEI